MMLSRALRRQSAVPLTKRHALKSLSKRTVTTDAASSHAEKENVPSVCELAWFVFDFYAVADMTFLFRKMINLSRSNSPMRASRPMN